MLGAMKARTLPIYCIYTVYIYENIWVWVIFLFKNVSSRYPPQFKGIGLPRLISAAIPDLWEWKWWVSDRGKVPIKVHRVNAHCNNADFKSISALWLMQLGSNWARIALINVSKLSDGNVLPLKISTSLSYYFLSENDARNLPAAWFSQNFVQQTRLRTTIDINMISSTTPACQRDSYYTGVQNQKKGVRHTFNIYLYNASQSYTIQTMLINLRQSQLEEKQPSLPEQIIFWLHSSWYLFFCFRSPVHFRPSTLQRPATAQGQGHLKQCPKARRSINRRSLLSSFCNSLPTYLSFYVNHWTWMSMI